jgi:hypothetical protein
MYQRCAGRRPIVASGFVLVVSLVIFFPYLVHADVLLGPHSGLGTDISYRHWPDLIYYSHILREEHTIPLWDDSVAGGRPLAGDPGVLWLYPFDLIFLWMPPALAFNWLAMLHVFIGGLGSYVFLRKGLRLSTLAALIGGLAYLASPKVLAHLAGGHVGLGYGAAWIPWALLGTHRASEGDWKGMLLAAVALAFQLPTHVQIPFYTAWLMAAYALWRLATARPLTHPVRRLVVLAGIIPCFVMLSAALLFPLLGLLPYTSRQGFSLEGASWYSLPPLLLATLVAPTNFQFPEWVLYSGAVPLILAILAFFGSSRRESFFWGGVVLFSLVYAIGPATPLFPFLHRLPGFAQLRVPPRIWFIGGFSMTVLAALGAEEALTARRIQRWRRWLILLAFAVIGAEAGAVVAFLILRTSPWRLIATLVTSLVALGLLVTHYRGKLQAHRFQILILILLLAELVPTAWFYTEPVPVSEILKETPALDFLRQQPGLWRVYSSHAELPYASAAQERIEAAEGLLALQIGHYVDLVKHASGCLIQGYGTGVPPCLTAEIDPLAYEQARPQPALLGLLNVRFVLTSLIYQNPDLKLSADFGEERIYENQRWLPRAFVVFQTRTLPDQSSILDSLNKIDPGQTALLTEPLSYAPEEPLPPIPAEVLARTANGTTVHVHLQRPGFLVVSRTWMPGWKAWIDGEQTAVYRVDYALQGVQLPTGEHTIHFRYEPIEWRLGWPLSLISAAIAVTSAVVWAFYRY